MDKYPILMNIASFLPLIEIPKFSYLSKKINYWFKNYTNEKENEILSSRKYFYNVNKYCQGVSIKFSHMYAQKVYKYRICDIEYYFYIYCTPIYPGHEVFVRYTLNNWLTYAEIKCIWINNNDNKELWRGTLEYDVMRAPDILKIKFAVRATPFSKKYEVWDNNQDKDYYFEINKPI